MIFSDGTFVISDESAGELEQFARLIGLRAEGGRIVLPENAVNRAGNRGAVFVPRAALERINRLVAGLRNAPVAHGAVGFHAQMAARNERLFPDA